MSQEASNQGYQESALTAPADRNPDKSYLKKLKGGVPSLNDEQTAAAMENLNVTAFVERFPAVERHYADRPLPMQQVGLVSFVPAKGATPNEQGIFGFMKLRGNFATEVEANGRAEDLIRNEDSYHKIFHTYVGRPFPLTVSSNYSAETSEIDIRKSMTDSVSADIQQKKKAEKDEIREMQERQKALLADTTDRKEADPYEEYITAQVKLATLKFTYAETQKKMDEMKASIIRARKQVADAEAENPTYKNDYFERYMQARRDAGLKDEKGSADNFIRYMVEDIDIGF